MGNLRRSTPRSGQQLRADGSASARVTSRFQQALLANGGWRIAIAGAVLVGFAAPAASLKTNPLETQRGNASHSGGAARSMSSSASSDAKDRKAALPCIGAEHGDLSCDAIAARAAYDQARDADRQIWIGWFQAAGVALSLVFSGAATLVALKALGKSNETLDETKRMNAAVVRPIVAVDAVWIEFNLTNYQPKIGLATHNVSAHTALDFEWQVVLTYGNRRSRVFPWFTRGVRGVNLPPGDRREQIPKTLTFNLNDAEAAAASEIDPAQGLNVGLTLFTRSYDAFGNPVDDKHSFFVVVHDLANAAVGPKRRFQAVPPGTRIEGEDDRIPESG